MSTTKDTLLNFITKNKKIFFSETITKKELNNSIFFSNNIYNYIFDRNIIIYSDIEKFEKDFLELFYKENKNLKINLLTTSNKISKNITDTSDDITGKNNIRNSIKGVKKVIIVSSCKGGVGKTTIASVIAKKLQSKNFKIGILDADIYGPSVPLIFNLENQKPEIINNKFIPLDSYGIKLMSIGFLTPTEGAIAWRGPMLTKALNQMIFSTNWDNLDYLIIDMPPGTGDIHISLAKMLDLYGCILVSIPDKLSVADLARSIELYKILQIRMLGIVENMSYINLPNNIIEYPFSQNLIQKIADKNSLQIIGKTPMIFGFDLIKNWKDLEIEINKII